MEIFLDTIQKQSKNGMSNRQLVLKPHIAVMVFWDLLSKIGSWDSSEDIPKFSSINKEKYYFGEFSRLFAFRENQDQNLRSSSLSS